MSLRFVLYATLTAGSLLLNSGCAPYPHRIYSRPDIEGAFVVDSVPARNAEVLIGTSPIFQEPCKGAVPVGMTNERGEFSLAGLNELEIMYSFLNPPELVGKITMLCFRAVGEPVIFGGEFFTHTNKPARLKILCDPTLPKQRSPSGLPQICR